MDFSSHFILFGGSGGLGFDVGTDIGSEDWPIKVQTPIGEMFPLQTNKIIHWFLEFPKG